MRSRHADQNTGPGELTLQQQFALLLSSFFIAICAHLKEA